MQQWVTFYRMSGKGVVVVGRSLTWRDRDHDTKRVVVVVGVSFFLFHTRSVLLDHPHNSTIPWGVLPWTLPHAACGWH